MNGNNLMAADMPFDNAQLTLAYAEHIAE